MEEFLNYLCKIWKCRWDIRKNMVCLHFGKKNDLLYVLRKYKEEKVGVSETVFYLENISIEEFLMKYGGEFVYVYYPRVGNIKIPDLLEWNIEKVVKNETK